MEVLLVRMVSLIRKANYNSSTNNYQGKDYHARYTSHHLWAIYGFS